MTVTVELPSDAANVASPALVVVRIGVTSTNVVPCIMYVFFVVPRAIYLVPVNDTHCFIFRHVPINDDVYFFTHPPIFSGKPDLNLTKLASKNRPSLLYAVPSL